MSNSSSEGLRNRIIFIYIETEPSQSVDVLFALRAHFDQPPVTTDSVTTTVHLLVLLNRILSVFMTVKITFI